MGYKGCGRDWADKWATHNEAKSQTARAKDLGKFQSISVFKEAPISIIKISVLVSIKETVNYRTYYLQQAHVNDGA